MTPWWSNGGSIILLNRKGCSPYGKQFPVSRCSVRAAPTMNVLQTYDGTAVLGNDERLVLPMYMGPALAVIEETTVLADFEGEAVAGRFVLVARTAPELTSWVTLVR